MKYTIGIDVGGTKINTALIDSKFRVMRKLKILLDKKDKKSILDRISYSVASVSSSVDRKQITGAGIGVPGTVSADRTKTGILPNLPSLNHAALPALLAQKLHLPVRMENDAHCAAFGEFLTSSAKKNSSLVCITVGTGIGGGIILDGKIYRGTAHAGEFGHMTLAENGLQCHCGNRGCLEEYVSKRGLARLARQNGLQETDALQLQHMAEAGSKKAIQVYSSAGAYLGIGISNIIKILDPASIVLAGGIAKSGPLLISPALREVKKRTFSSFGRIAVSKHVDDIGAIGAAGLFAK